MVPFLLYAASDFLSEERTRIISGHAILWERETSPFSVALAAHTLGPANFLNGFKGLEKVDFRPRGLKHSLLLVWVQWAFHGGLHTAESEVVATLTTRSDGSPW